MWPTFDQGLTIRLVKCYPERGRSKVNQVDYPLTNIRLRIFGQCYECIKLICERPVLLSCPEGVREYIGCTTNSTPQRGLGVLLHQLKLYMRNTPCTTPTLQVYWSWRTPASSCTPELALGSYNNSVIKHDLGHCSLVGGCKTFNGHRQFWNIGIVKLKKISTGDLVHRVA